MGWDKRQQKRANLLEKMVANGFWGSDGTKAGMAETARMVMTAQRQGWGRWRKQYEGDDSKDAMKVRIVRTPQW